MIELAVYLKRSGYRPRQVQDFIPAPMDVATCIYYTGLDPETGQPVHSAHKLRERSLQRALLQFFKPENHAAVKRALQQAGREDLIGDGPDCLIPARAPGRAPGSRRPASTGRGGEGAPSRPEAGGGAGSPGYRRAARLGGRRPKGDKGS